MLIIIMITLLKYFGVIYVIFIMINITFVYYKSKTFIKKIKSVMV